MKSRGVKTRNGLIVMLLLTVFLFGCGEESAADIAALDGEEAEEQVIDVQKLHEANSDIFAWIKIPGTTIEAPVLQSSEGDDSYYASHDYVKRYDPDGALYIEAANGNDMCDFNTVIHGSSPSDGSRFAGLSQFLDRTYFDENQFIYIYLDGNALVYYIFAAYLRDDTRLLEQYDFSYASGCQAFLDEIYDSRSMSKIIRNGWEDQVVPENFLVTLTTTDPATGKQLVVIGSLIGDVAGTIDRYVDYGDPE